MHVVHLVSAGQLGGAETSVLEMVGSLRQAHPEWMIRVLTPADGPMLRRLEALGIPSACLPFPKSLERLGEAGRVGTTAGRLRLCAGLLASLAGAFRYRRALRRWLASGTTVPAIVHAHGFKMQILAAAAAPSTSRLVWHMHDYVTPRAASVRILRRLASRCAAVVANSKSVAADVGTAFGAAPPVHVIYNAVDLHRFTPSGDRCDLDRAAGVSAAAPGTIRIGLIATFGRWKGHEVFLRALSLLPCRDGVRGYVIGGPVYQTAGSQQSAVDLRQLADELGLGQSVAFTGALENIPSAMRALDVVVHASTAPEPFGMVIAEGMASGRAVVASLVGGSAELVQEGIDALGSPAGDAIALAGNLQRLIDDASLRRRLGEAARKTAERRFDRARLGDELSGLYLRLSPAGSTRRGGRVA